MRIALIMDGLGGGGAERQCVLAANELARQEHHVTLISYGTPDYCVRFIDREKVQFVHITARGRLRIGRIRALRRVLKDGHFDVAHAFHEPPSVFGGIAAGLAHVPRFLMGCRGQVCLTRRNRLPLRLLARGCDGWIVNSPAVKRHVIHAMSERPERIHIVRNGVPPIDLAALRSRDVVRQELGLGPAVPMVTLVGNLRAVKNIDMLLRAAARLVEAGSSVRFVIAGEGTEGPRLKAACRSLKLDDRVQFIGYCRDVPSLLAASDVVTLTSRSEGLPNALIEAALASVPAVSSDNGGAHDVIVDGLTGYVVPLDDDAAMADRVMSLLSDDDNRRAMGAAARAYALKTFSIEQMAQQLLRVYRGEDVPLTGPGLTHKGPD